MVDGHQSEIICFHCNGTNKQTMIKPDKKTGVEERREVLCLASSETAKEVWDSMTFLLAQFIRCKADGVFDSKNPFKSKCAGCEYEREEILSHVWHYGELVLAEKKAKFSL